MTPLGTLPLAASQVLAEKIRGRRARVGIVGLGYVGLPLAVEFAKAGFTVTGIDISEDKARRVNAADSYVGDIPSATLAPLVESGRLRATTDFSAVLDLDTYLADPGVLGQQLLQLSLDGIVADGFGDRDRTCRLGGGCLWIVLRRGGDPLPGRAFGCPLRPSRQ